MNIVDHSYNLWNEKWELGAYSPSNGTKVESSVSLRNKEPIPIRPNRTYYIKCNPVGAKLYFYDISKNYLSTALANNSTFTSPNNAYFLSFNSGNASVPITDYNHDICINVSKNGIDGNYYPYYYKRYDIVDLIHTHNLWNKTVKYNQLRNPSTTIPTYGTFNQNIYTITSLGLIGYNQNRLNSTINIKQNHRYLIMVILKSPKSGSSFISDFSSNTMSSLLSPSKDYSIVANTQSLLAYIANANATNQTEIRLGMPTSNNSAIGDKIEVNLFVIIDITNWFKNDIPQALLDDPSTFNEYWNGELTYDTGTDVLPNNSIQRLKIGG